MVLLGIAVNVGIGIELYLRSTIILPYRPVSAMPSRDGAGADSATRPNPDSGSAASTQPS